MSESQPDQLFTTNRQLRNLVNRRSDELLAAINTLEERIVMKLSELAAAQNALADRVDALAVKVQALKDSIGDPNLPPDAETAIARLDTSVAAVEALLP